MKIIAVPVVDSTNLEAKRLVEAGRPLGFAVSAGHQIAGRGRLGRTWHHLPGNLAITIAVSRKKGDFIDPTLALVTGLAIHRTVFKFIEHCAPVAIKWPNDVLVAGRKISGTLIEAEAGVLYVGIGLNIAEHPNLEDYPTTSMSEYVDVDKDVFARALVNEWFSRYVAWLNDGWDGSSADYNERLSLTGKSVRFAYNREKAMGMSGICRGVDKHGCLVIEDHNGRRCSYAPGDVECVRT